MIDNTRSVLRCPFVAVLAALAGIVLVPKPGPAATLQAGKYQCINGFGQCQVEVCDYDTIIWDNLTVNVGSGFVPGRYEIKMRSQYQNVEPVDIIVDGSGGYTVDLGPNGGNYWGAWSINVRNEAHTIFYFDLDGKPPGAQASVVWDTVAIYPVSCPPGGYNAGVILHGNVTVTIGPPPVPEPANTKSCDVKSSACPGPGCGGGVPPPMAVYTAHSMLASLNIEDTPFRFAPSIGPAIDFTLTYNQREPAPPISSTYSNLGPKWSFNWSSFIIDDPAIQQSKIALHPPRGGVEVFTFPPGSQTSSPEPQSHAVLVRSTNSYEKDFPDGSKHIYGLTDGSNSYPRKVFLTQVVDAAGNATTIGYETDYFRVTTLTDALGNTFTLSYELSGDVYKVTKIAEPTSFGLNRSASFEYTNGRLTKITDEIGIESIFTYSPGTDFIDSLTTPYGTSHFATDQNGTNKWVEMTDPLGGKERVEYRDNAPDISGSDPSGTVPAGFTNSDLDVANTFYWDKKYTTLHPPDTNPYDYTKAKIIHWAKNSDGSISGIKASEKAPLENRVWYAYEGQSDTNHTGPSANPIKVARVLDNGSPQIREYQYNNSFGKMTRSIDPVGRVMSYDYDPANHIDLLAVRQTRGSNDELLRTMTYNSQHKPLTDTDAAGQTTIYFYNSFGQVTSVQNAKGETTTYDYGDGTSVPTGYLASITSPPFNGNSAVTSFTYDDARRVHTVTNEADDYTVTTDYDNLDRPTTITYPDTTTQEFNYTQDFMDGRGVQKLLDVYHKHRFAEVAQPCGITTRIDRWIHSPNRSGTIRRAPHSMAGVHAAR